MKLRENHPIFDRLKVIFILCLVLFCLYFLARVTQKSQEESVEQSGTIGVFLEKAMEPVGTTMYIWGGGWDDEDEKAGSDSTRLGLSPEWRVFMESQDETYDFNDYRFEREKGLDCSGYVGWVVYNTFHKKAGGTGYVCKSTEMAETYATKGWGQLIKNPVSFLPGDVVSMEGHVWISLGTCQDGSVLLVHSSPPGVMVCGTPVPRKGGKSDEGQENTDKSIAIQLAEKYMRTYHSTWYEKYPESQRSYGYLENVTLLRWNTDTMKDAKMYQSLKAEEVLKHIEKVGNK